MVTRYDFKLDDDGDLYIDPVTKDIVIVPSDKQHVRDILMSAPGWFKEFPLVGFNPYKRLNARVSQQEINSAAKIQLEGDGYKVKNLSLEISSGGEVTLNVLELK